MVGKKKIDAFTIFLHIFFVLFSACFIIPLILGVRFGASGSNSRLFKESEKQRPLLSPS